MIAEQLSQYTVCSFPHQLLGGYRGWWFVHSSVAYYPLECCCFPCSGQQTQKTKTCYFCICVYVCACVYIVCVYIVYIVCVCVWTDRSSLLGRPTSSFSPPPDSSPFQPSAEQVRISTQAEVHSDSDSLHAGWGDGPAIPTHEVGGWLHWRGWGGGDCSPHTVTPPPPSHHHHPPPPFCLSHPTNCPPHTHLSHALLTNPCACPPKVCALPCSCPPPSHPTAPYYPLLLPPSITSNCPLLPPPPPPPTPITSNKI